MRLSLVTRFAPTHGVSLWCPLAVNPPAVLRQHHGTPGANRAS
jgi:hypothetical protein